MKFSSQKYFAIAAAIFFIIIGFVWFFKNGADNEGNNGLYPVTNFLHGHGLAVDIADSNKVYIATHEGLFVILNDKDLYRVGKYLDDYMGFSPHPADPRIFFSSGHPRNGGNIGVQKSEDGGITWKKISDGARGPVDFHAMAISPANPDILYGWFYNMLQRSVDGGKNWDILPPNLPLAINIVPDPQNQEVVFATTLQGLRKSEDKGMTWAASSGDLKDGVPIALAIHPKDSKKMLSFSQKLGLAKSNDGGGAWTKINENFGGEMLLYISIAPQDPSIVYALTKENALYKSSDEGLTWIKLSFS